MIPVIRAIAATTLSVGVALSIFVAPQAQACSYGLTPPYPVEPEDSATGVPTNAKVTVLFGVLATPNGPVDQLQLERVESDGGFTTVPCSYELRPWRNSMNVTVRLAPTNGLEPKTDYAVRWADAGGGGTGDVTVSTFTTGSTADTTVPTAPEGVTFTRGKLLPDAGGGCGGPGGPVYEVIATLPDAGPDARWFASIGDAGVFSSFQGGGTTIGYAACTAVGPPSSGWNINVGPSEVTVWTEDIAGNASAPMTVSTNIDCEDVSPASNGQPYDYVGTDDREVKTDRVGPFGCSATGSGFVGGVAALIVALQVRRRRAQKNI